MSRSYSLTVWPHRLGSLAPVSPSSVHPCEPVIADLIHDLQDRTPVRAEGVALLQQAIADGDGPFYTANSADDLQSRLDVVRRMLHPPQ